MNTCSYKHCYQLIVCSFLFPMMYGKSILLFIKIMTCERICNFYYDSAKKSVKTKVNYFKKRDVPQSSIYYALKKYGVAKDLSRSTSLLKLSKKNLNNIVKSINNRCGLDQCEIARRFKVHYAAILPNLPRRTSIVIRKSRKAPKME